MKAKISYPDELRERVLTDLKESEKQMNQASEKMSKSWIIKKFSKKVLGSELLMTMNLKELNQNSCIVEVDFTGSALVGEGKIFNMFKDQAKRYNDDRVKVEKL